MSKKYLDIGRKDLVALILGTVYGLSEEWWYIALASTSSLAAALLWYFTSVTVSSWHEVCCYSRNPPSHAQFDHGGACDDPNSLMYGEGDQAACLTWPIRSYILLGTGIACALIVFILPIVTSKRSRERFEKLSFRRQELKGLHKRGYPYMGPEPVLQLDHVENLAPFFVPILFGLLSLHEAANGRHVFTFIRIITLILIIILGLVVYVFGTLIREWSCYENFVWTWETLKVLNEGTCTDTTSRAYAITKGAQNTPTIYWIMFSILIGAVVINILTLLIGQVGMSCLGIRPFATVAIEVAAKEEKEIITSKAVSLAEKSKLRSRRNNNKVNVTQTQRQL